VLEMTEENPTLDYYLDELRKKQNNPKTLRNLLRYLRQTRTRRSDAVVLYGKLLLTKYPSYLQDVERKYTIFLNDLEAVHSTKSASKMQFLLYYLAT
jgi:hypothetical protein